MKTVMAQVRLRRRAVMASVLGTLAAWGLPGCGGGGGEAPAPVPEAKPVGGWAATMSDWREDVGFLNIPAPPFTTFQNATVRQTVRVALGGERIRLKFSNLYGQSALPLAKVVVAFASAAGRAGAEPILATSPVAVTFQGAAGITLAPGAEVWSDALPLAVQDGSLLAVSTYVRDAADACTIHRYANAVNAWASGDMTGAASLPTAPENQLTTLHWLAAVEVYRRPATPVLVAFGDSLTDGNGSTAGANLRYPDQLSARFLAAGRAVSVVNAGMGGNRWLHDRFGLRGVERFRRDVLSVTGVSHAIVQMGINDIGFQLSWTPGEKAATADLTASLAGALAQANAAGVKVYLATLTPFKGHVYYSEAGEQMRQEVNAWIRSNRDAAGILDFDAAVRDPAEPARIAAAYRSDDNLHLNDLGYTQLAGMIPLNIVA